MTFGSTLWLLGTLAICLSMAGLVALGFRRREQLLRRFAAERLLDQLTGAAAVGRSLLKAALVVAAAACIGLALARPQLGVESIERRARGLDIVFLLDSSRSMLAEDLRPSRLERAKLAVRDLVERLETDRIGLVAFAGQAFLQTPPTLDYNAFRESLDAVDPSIMSRGGSDIGQALREAASAFGERNNHKVALLLTDGEDLGGGVLEAAETAAQEGITVHAIGIGTPEGEYLRIPQPDGSDAFVRDPDGQPVRSQLDEATLRQIAETTGGRYYRLGRDPLDRLYDTVLAALPRGQQTSRLEERPIERFQWPLAAALVLLSIELLLPRRPRSSALAPLCLFGLLATAAPPPLAAQAGPEAPPGAEAEPPAEAPTGPHERFNAAHALLREGRFESALRGFEQTIRAAADPELQADALYNAAHATYQMGEAALQARDFPEALDQWREAEALFDSVTEIRPDDRQAVADAQAVARRREALEAFLEQQKQSQPPPEDDASGDASEGEEGDQEQTEGSRREADEADPSSDGASGEESAGAGEAADEEAERSGDDSATTEDAASGGGADRPQADETAPGRDPAGPQEQNREDAPPEKDRSTAAGEREDGDAPVPGTSTADPRDDLPPEPESGDPAPGDPPESGEAEAAAGSAAADADGRALQGMTEAEARALLDSLRDSERLLPFFAPANERRGTPAERRDW